MNSIRRVGIILMHVYAVAALALAAAFFLDTNAYRHAEIRVKAAEAQAIVSLSERLGGA